MFVYRKWDWFCRKLANNNKLSVTAADVIKNKPSSFLILKHDVETNPKKALTLAKIESKYGHRGSYYVQAYILEKKKYIEYLTKIQELGHEVSYHQDVMDQCKGDMVLAEKVFCKCYDLFKRNGFLIQTVCQHGNAVMERKGYNGNRDFFRNKNISKKYCNITEIMVNFRQRCGDSKYLYVSDAGYSWNIIAKPEENDIRKDLKNTPLESIGSIIDLAKDNSVIVSTHPHRWHAFAIGAWGRQILFTVIKKIAKILFKIPFLRKLMLKHYQLAKKI